MGLTPPGTGGRTKQAMRPSIGEPQPVGELLLVRLRWSARAQQVRR